MKRIVVLIIVLVMMVSLCACGVKEVDVLGLWQRETVYLSSYDCEADLFVVFGDNGEYLQLLLEHESGEMLNMETGYWEIIDGEIVCIDETNPGAATIYQYSNGKLQNGELTLTWLSETDSFTDMLK